MKRINYAPLALVAFAAILALSGCSDSKQVSEVKALPFELVNSIDLPQDLTVDQALDNRKVCDDIKWTTDKDNQGETIVTYRCDYKGVDDSLFVKNGGLDVKSAGDVYQWTYGRDDKPALTAVAAIINQKDGKSVDIAPGQSPNYIIWLAFHNTAKNFDEAYSQLSGKAVPPPPEATKSASLIPDTTYGNKLAQFFPGQPAKDAAIHAYLQKGMSQSTKSSGLDSAGYLALEDSSETRALVYPVDPADVQIGFKVDPAIVPEILKHSLNNIEENKLFCLNDYCYDIGAHLVGKATPEVLAKEDSRVNSYSQIMLDNWVAQPGLTQQVVLTPSQLETTYGNKLAQLFPGKSPQDAAKAAYLQKGLPANAGIRVLDSLGYLTLFDAPSVRQYLFPVDPSDVQIAVKAGQPNTLTSGIHVPQELQNDKLICLSDLCYDQSGNLVGKATPDVLAKEVKEVSITKFGDIQEVAQTQQPVQAPSQPAMQQPVQQDANAQPAKLDQLVAQATQPNAPVSASTADPLPVGAEDWPTSTPCIKKLEDAYRKDRQAHGLDNTISMDQDNDFASTCKTVGQ